MSTEILLALLAATWIGVAVAPSVISTIDSHRRHLADIRAAEELADRQLRKAIASLRRERAQ